MPEYKNGGAEKQFGLVIDRAEKEKWKLDVLITHRFGGNVDKTLYNSYKNVRFYEMYLYNIVGVTELAMMESFLSSREKEIRYINALCYYCTDLHFVDVLCNHGIDLIYSERNAADEILTNNSLNMVARKCCAIVCNSSNAKEKIEKNIGIPVKVINNGIEIEDILPRKNGGIKNILVPARISRIKRQLFLLEFLNENREEYKVVLAGSFQDKTYFLKIKHYIEDNGLDKIVEIVGETTDMRTLYEWADVVALSSLYEGTPNVVLEAYMYGRPVIVSDIEANRRLVDDAYRFGLDDLIGISKCLNYLKNLSLDDYDQLIDYNRKLVEMEYSVDSMVEAYSEYLKV